MQELETTMVEQEHRPVQLVMNFWKRKERWPEGDGRRYASVRAFFWRIFFSPGTVALVGGGLGLLSLGVLAYQTKLMREQNVQFTNQIAFQEESFKSARKTDLINLLNSGNRNTKQSAFIEFYGDSTYYNHTTIILDDTLRVVNADLSNYKINDFGSEAISLNSIYLKKGEMSISADRLTIINSYFHQLR